MNDKPESITYLAGVARSGTSWLGQIFDSSPEVRYSFQPLFSYEFKNRVNEDSTKNEFDELLNDIYNLDSPFLSQTDKRQSGEYPTFKKKKKMANFVLKENRYQYIIEPLMRKSPKVQLVCIIRNPNAVLNSWMKTPKEFPVGSDPIKEWRFANCKNKGNQDFFGYYKWKEVCNLYIDLHLKWPNRVYLLKYEDLVESTVDKVKELFKFCNIKYNNQTHNFINKSTNTHNDSLYSVYKNKEVATKWKNELDPYITEEIKNDLSNTRLEQFI